MTSPTETPTDEAPAEEQTAVEERDFLLRSLDDLDAEYEAGDLERDDYETLRDGYVARAAVVLRAIDEHRQAPPDAPPTARGRRRTIAWVAGVVVVAGLCGWLLARSVGSKSSGDTITGNALNPLDSCQTLSFQKPAQGVTCYDKILATEPDDPDALTYKGWALVRMGKTAEGTQLFDRVVAANPTYPDVHVFLASVKANASDFRGAQDELNTLYSLHPPAGVISTLQSQGLDREIAYGLLPGPVRTCWKSAEVSLEQLATGSTSAKASGGITTAIECLKNVLTTDPNDVDALDASGYLLGASASGSAELARTALADLDRAIAVAPTDATAYLLRAALENVSGDSHAALDDLTTLKTLGRPSPLYPVATAASIEQDARSSLHSATTTTTR